MSSLLEIVERQVWLETSNVYLKKVKIHRTRMSKNARNENNT